jgi:hypothetical protein
MTNAMLFRLAFIVTNNQGGGHGRQVRWMFEMGDMVVIPNMVAITTLEP